MKRTAIILLISLCTLSSSAQLRLDSALLAAFSVKSVKEQSGAKKITVYGTKATADRIGRALEAQELDGKDDYLELNTDLSDKSFTLSFYFLTDSSRTNDTSRYSLLSFGCEKGTDLNLSHSKNTVSLGRPGQKSVSSKVKAGDYHHLLLAYDQTRDEYKLYVDGAFSGKMKGTESNSIKKFWLGRSAPCDSASGLRYFKGKIDELRIYERVLNICEISALHNGLEDAGESFFATAWKQDLSWSFSFDKNEDEDLLDFSQTEPAADRFGKEGKALYFDGRNSHLTISEEQDLKFGAKSSWSISVFAKPEINQGTYIYGSGGVGQKKKYSGGAIITRYGCPQVNQASDLIKLSYENDFISLSVREKNAEDITELIYKIDKAFFEKFHHFMVVRDAPAEMLYLYIDGILVAQKELNREGGMSTKEVAWWIGKDVSCNDGVDHDSYRFFKGTIDEIYLYDRALLPCEIQELNSFFSKP